jgi:hypothetical protein
MVGITIRLGPGMFFSPRSDQPLSHPTAVHELTVRFQDALRNSLMAMGSAPSSLNLG